MSTAPNDFLSAAEATQMLGIRKQTLYAYVSRGLVRSMANGPSREKRYALEDLRLMQARSRAPAGPGARYGAGGRAAAAPGAGHPQIPTGITDITPEGPRYRGRLATSLVRQGASFEQVAELLWTGLWHERGQPWQQVSAPQRLELVLGQQNVSAGGQQLAEVFTLVVMHLAMGRGPLQDRLISGRPLEAAREMCVSLAGCFGLLSARGRFQRARSGTPVAQALLEAMGADSSRQDCALLDAALILLAGQDPSSATWAARTAAAGGSSVHSCIAAAMAASAGVEGSRAYDRLENFLARAPRGTGLADIAFAQLKAGQDVPGFGSDLPAGGDPRAACLLDLVSARKNNPPAVKLMLSLAGQLQASHGLQASHEFAMLAACKALGLPAEAPAALAVFARTVGWVAHTLEQRLSGAILQPDATPRARFVPSDAAEAPAGQALRQATSTEIIPKPEIEPDVAGRLNVVWDESSPNGRMAHLVKDAARSFLRSLQARLAMENVTLGHWTFLRILWEKDGITQRELSYEAGVMEPTTVVALRAMESLGYVTRERRGENRKSFYVFLTPLGRSLQLRLVPLAEEVNALAVFGLEADNVTITRRSLQLMLDNLAGDPVLAAEAAPVQMHTS